jgi:polyhydroxyalkanoate synthesis repressor PhaR
VTLEDLAAMVKAGEDFVVYDAKTGEDITRSVLAQIIFEQENKEGQNLLPINFLRQLIRFYGDSMQMLVPRYLEVSLESLTREQEKFRQQMAQAFGGTPFGALEEQARRNMEMFERAFAMFAPFGRRSGQGTGQGSGQGSGQASTEAEKSAESAGGSGGDEIDDLKRQMEEMQKRLDRLSQKDRS